MRYVVRSPRAHTRGEPIGWIEAKDEHEAAALLTVALTESGHPHFHHADDPDPADWYTFEEMPAGADQTHYETWWDMPSERGPDRRVLHVFNLARLGAD